MREKKEEKYLYECILTCLHVHWCSATIRPPGCRVMTGHRHRGGREWEGGEGESVCTTGTWVDYFFASEALFPVSNHPIYVGPVVTVLVVGEQLRPFLTDTEGRGFLQAYQRDSILFLPNIAVKPPSLAKRSKSSQTYPLALASIGLTGLSDEVPVEGYELTYIRYLCVTFALLFYSGVLWLLG
jgi:hypothetical protein